MTVRRNQVRRMSVWEGGDTYTVLSVDHAKEKVHTLTEDGRTWEWLLESCEKDEIVTDALPDPENPQVGDRFQMFDRPDRTYEVLEVGKSTVTVRYSIETTWPTDYCKRDVPL